VLGTIQDCLKRRIVATGTVAGVSRRVYEETRATATANVVAAFIGPSVIGSVSLQTSRPVPGTLRECTAVSPSGTNPAIGC
jgi:hypothetical protein